MRVEYVWHVVEMVGFVVYLSFIFSAYVAPIFCFCLCSMAFFWTSQPAHIEWSVSQLLSSVR
jgi:hypothetical protein